MKDSRSDWDDNTDLEDICNDKFDTQLFIQD